MFLRKENKKGTIYNQSCPNFTIIITTTIITIIIIITITTIIIIIIKVDLNLKN